MTEENQALGAENQEAEEAAREAAVSSQEQETPQAGDNRNYEAEAREMGWVPEEEFNGPKGKWKDAKQFVEDGERILPIVRSQLKRTQDELAKKDAEFAKRIERIERMSKVSMERQKAQHKTELDRIKKEMRKAAEEGDTARYDQLDVQREELAGQSFDEPQDDGKSDYDRAVQDFSSRNNWYGTDDVMTAWAEGYSQKIARDNPNISIEDNLKRVEAAAKEKFPDKFGGKKPAANGHAAVDGGGSFPAAPRRGKGAAQLPAEARAAGERFVKEGLFKNIEEYAKDYFND